jgi:hypothetical protein
MNKKLVAGLVSLAAGAGVAIAVAPPAQASSMYGCSYPKVCLKDGSYQSGTVFWGGVDTVYQHLPPSGQNRADSVVNTRNDDSVWLIDTGSSPDRYICIPRNTAVNLGDYTLSGTNTWANDVDTVRIWSDDGTCSGTYNVVTGTRPDGWRG